ncbi:hypothetical protein SAY86_025499 [Trapa natans]|uniref:RING-type E3 ubiquitin transferase n=1 Tax=Trapa natans TaxID=22666 RepID=A0AAN7RCE5_TRANT|nr:hypothetical protein SAY86_025499 [Trapa natans]
MAASGVVADLVRLVAEVVGDEDGWGVDTIDEAVGVISTLRELVVPPSVRHEKPPASSGFDDAAAVPPEFLCPISKRLMHDPVVLETGQTYDRVHIEEVLSRGDWRCPVTQRRLSHSVLIPNNLIREGISRWCKERGMELPKSMPDPWENAVSEPNRDYFLLLLDKFSTSSSLEDQRAAANELRQLTKRSSQAFLVESPSRITSLLVAATQRPELQDDLMIVVLNLSACKENRKLMEDDPFVVPLLIELMGDGSIKARGNAAAALLMLLDHDSSKRLVGELGAFGPLIRLIEQAEPLAINDVVSAISSLCSIAENKEIAVRERAVAAVLGKIKSSGPSDQLIYLLASFSTNQDAADQMGELGAVSCLLGILKDTTDEHRKEHCVAILYEIACRSSSKLREIRRDEKINGTLSAVARSRTSTSRAKRKANSILNKICRTHQEMHTS